MCSFSIGGNSIRETGHNLSKAGSGPPAHESEKSGHDKLSQNSTFSVNSNAVSLQAGKIVDIFGRT